jgi:hypothetical protein
VGRVAKRAASEGVSVDGVVGADASTGAGTAAEVAGDERSGVNTSDGGLPDGAVSNAVEPAEAIGEVRVGAVSASGASTSVES